MKLLSLALVTLILAMSVEARAEDQIISSGNNKESVAVSGENLTFDIWQRAAIKPTAVSLSQLSTGVAAPIDSSKIEWSAANGKLHLTVPSVDRESVFAVKASDNDTQLTHTIRVLPKEDSTLASKMLTKRSLVLGSSSVSVQSKELKDFLEKGDIPFVEGQHCGSADLMLQLAERNAPDVSCPEIRFIPDGTKERHSFIVLTYMESKRRLLVPESFLESLSTERDAREALTRTLKLATNFFYGVGYEN